MANSVTRTAVALSGGGHRACVFALGVLLYLADCGRNRQVTSVASVSGGSLANGALAQQLDLPSAAAADVETFVKRVATQIAGSGTLFASRLTRFYLVALAVLIPAVLVGTWLLPFAIVPRVAVFLFGLVLLGLLISLRGRVCGRAFAKTVLSGSRRSARLADISREADHVICATDLHAGEHVYFSGGFVCSYRFGVGQPANLPLHRAVQASAAFPGAFPAAWVRTADFGFRGGLEEASGARSLTLHDGGVYDNMADQWGHGLDRRNERWAGLGASFRPADELVVVSASAGLGWNSTFALRLPLIGELFTLLRDKSVLYDNGNSVRRRELVARFDLAEREGRGLRGVLVHIPQSPFDVPDAFLGAQARWPERAARAAVVLAGLIGAEDEEDARKRWQAIADDNAAIGTVLSRLGIERTARLLHHAYVLAMVNLHVVLDYPLLELPSHERFAALAGEPVSD